MNVRTLGIAMSIGLCAALAAGCEPGGETRSERRTIAAAGASTARVRVKMGAGELRLHGGAAELLEAEFRTNRRRLVPDVDYSVSGGRGDLRIDQRRSGFSFRRIVNDWDLGFKDGLPLDLRVDLGAGESRLDLKGLELENVAIDMGVGDLRLDLTGPRAKSLTVSINGGVGSATILLPSGIGVRVKVDGGIGSVEGHGLEKRPGGLYVNAAYGRAPVSLEVEVDAGIGSLDLRSEEDEGGVRF